MKKTVSILLALVLMLSSLGAFAESDIILTVDGQVLNTDVPPIIKNDRTMVPFRAIFEALNIEVNWSDALRKAYATANGITVILTVDSDKMVVNDTVITLDAAPFIMNDRVLVPARAVCEALECTVTWNPNTRTAAVKTKGYVDPDPQPEVNPDPGYNETIGGDPEYIIKEDDYANSLLAGINAKRAEMGLGAFVYDTAVETVANAHAADMSARDYLDHTSPEGVTLSQRLDNANVYYVSAAENLASGFTTSQKVLEAWLNSPKHSANILSGEFTKIGIGFAAGGSNGTYWTLVFISE